MFQTQGLAKGSSIFTSTHFGGGGGRSMYFCLGSRKTSIIGPWDWGRGYICLEREHRPPPLPHSPESLLCGMRHWGSFSHWSPLPVPPEAGGMSEQQACLWGPVPLGTGDENSSSCKKHKGGPEREQSPTQHPRRALQLEGRSALPGNDVKPPPLSHHRITGLTDNPQ